jgi:hypothetical protein
MHLIICAPQVINELQNSGQLPQGRADDVKAKFARLHAALTGAMQREKELLDQARVLKRQLDSEKVRMLLQQLL